ncbi:MAG TPA: hypothetical protein VLG09_00200 [Candidatus Saccharimonadales bacterium]|nr:hypothetical protein [Candidatus Saccharimonadales bacterium]
MKLLTCDIGSTNLKLQIFTIDSEQSSPRPTGDARIITHQQNWLKTDQPLEALSEWLIEIAELITQTYGNEVDAMGFSTYREGAVGLSSTNQVVFAGTNLQATPLGKVEDASVMTTFAGWMCWKLTGQCYVTAGQRDAGNAYMKRVSQATIRWASLITAGENIQTENTHSFGVYLGGTDEQLGYIGTGLSDSIEPRLVIATGTFWSTSCIATGPSKQGVRRTEGEAPFRTVDSCVLYKWGPMMQGLAEERNSSDNELVPDRFFGRAASLWFSESASSIVTRQAAINDLKAACAMFSPEKDSRVVVYGGGVRSSYARDLIHEACEGLKPHFMDGDATLLGCAVVGKTILSKQ